MYRFIVTFCLLCLFVCSLGCKLPRSPHDYHVASFVDRHNDYRGFDPDYRAGSIFVDEHGMSHMRGNFANNAGDFGTVAPVVIQQHDVRPDRPSNVPDRAPGHSVPTIDELIQQRRDAIPEGNPMPIIPPMIPSPPFEPLPLVPLPNNEFINPPITLEELRRLDPTVRDLQIISIEDAAPGGWR